MSDSPTADQLGLPAAASVALLRKQRRRQRLVLLGTVTHVLNVAALLSFARLGWVDDSVALAYLVCNVVTTAMFYTIVASGWNLRFSDPTMAMEMIIAANVIGLGVLYCMRTTLARAVFSMLGLVAMTYAAMGLSRPRMLVTLSLTALGCVTVFCALWLLRSDGLNLRAEMVLLFAQLCALAQMAFFGSQLLVLRRKLEEQRISLDRALHRLNDRNERLHRELGEVAAKAARDELSGLHNRRHLMETMTTEIARSGRYGLPLSVALLDIDHFKRVNDTWGHAVGDIVLRQFSASVSERMRSIDCLGRYGGEEFLVVMSSTTLAEARVLAERIREHVKAIEFPGVPHGFRITLSAGVAQWQPGERAETTILRADHALYSAKGRGRDCVMASGETGRTIVRMSE